MLQQKSRQRSRNMMSTNFSTKLQIYCNSRELIIHTQPLNFDDTEMEVYGQNYTCSIHTVLMLDSWTFNDISPSLSFPLLPSPSLSFPLLPSPSSSQVLPIMCACRYCPTSTFPTSKRTSKRMPPPLPPFFPIF